MKMKSSLYKCVVLLLSTGFLGIPQIGQGQIDTAVEQLNEQNAKSYVQPLITAGVAFKLAGLILLNADYSLGTRNVATLGIGLGL